jgi:hypothetical protein
MLQALNDETVILAVKKSSKYLQLESLASACQKVMDAFAEGDDNLIIRSGYAGPAYQYSHGFSVFFPWAKPIKDNIFEEYSQYAFKETSWGDFLKSYFQETQRKMTRPKEDGKPVDMYSAAIDGYIYNESGQLSGNGPKTGSNDPTGSSSSRDPAGDCSCPTIKNHPRTTANEKNVPPAKGQLFSIRSDI